jgi:hypothetical protein
VRPAEPGEDDNQRTERRIFAVERIASHLLSEAMGEPVDHEWLPPITRAFGRVDEMEDEPEGDSADED